MSRQNTRDIRPIGAAFGVDLVLQLAEEYGPPLIGLRAVLRQKRRADGTEPLRSAKVERTDR